MFFNITKIIVTVMVVLSLMLSIFVVDNKGVYGLISIGVILFKHLEFIIILAAFILIYLFFFRWIEYYILLFSRKWFDKANSAIKLLGYRLYWTVQFFCFVSMKAQAKSKQGKSVINCSNKDYQKIQIIDSNDKEQKIAIFNVPIALTKNSKQGNKSIKGQLIIQKFADNGQMLLFDADDTI